MDRRDFLKAAGASVLAVAASAAAEALPEKGTGAPGGKKMAEEGSVLLAPPCGLYCCICMDYINKVCHGCGCTCGACAGQWHDRHCGIAQCARSRKLESCAQCDDLPCTTLIQFTVDPVWRTHAPCIENLRRRKKIGKDAWLAEQAAHWKDEKNLEAWLDLYRECSRKWNEKQKSGD